MSFFGELRRRNVVKVAVAYAIVGWTLTAANLAIGQSEDQHWVGTWSTSPQLPGARLGPVVLDGQTVRQIVHISIGGETLRVRLSNVLGEAPLEIDAATLGIQSEAAGIAQSSLRPLTFAGQPSIRIPTGARVVSDPVDIIVDAEDDLAISVYVAEEISPQTTHASAHQTSFISPVGNFTDRVTMPVEESVSSWFWLTGVEVLSGAASRAVVTFGDSITDGAGSTRDANARYPDVLARRLLERYPGDERISVLNAGIGGNRILTNRVGANALIMSVTLSFSM